MFWAKMAGIRAMAAVKMAENFIAVVSCVIGKESEWEARSGLERRLDAKRMKTMEEKKRRRRRRRRRRGGRLVQDWWGWAHGIGRRTKE
jgi:hypothetical protein